MNDVIVFLNNVGRGFVNFSASMLIQSCLLIVILLVVDLLIRRKVRAVFRYCVWMLVLVKLVLPTTLSLPTGLGYWLGLDNAAGVAAEVVMHVESVAGNSSEGIATGRGSLAKAPVGALVGGDVEMGREAGESEAQAVASYEVPKLAMVRESLCWQGWLFIGWFVVVAAMVLLLVQRMFFVRGLVRQSKRADEKSMEVLRQSVEQMRMSREVDIKFSHIAASPSVCGLFRHVILIPQGLSAKLTQSEYKAILLHELSHIKRGDLWVSMVQTLLQIVYFYNPLLWVGNSVIRKIREQAVDEMVLVAMGEAAEDYPQALLNVSRLAFSRSVLSLHLIGVVESKAALAGRIKHILNRPFPKSAKLGILGVAAVVIVALLLLPMARAESKDGAEGLSNKNVKAEKEVDSDIEEKSNTVSGVVVDELGRSLSYAQISSSGNSPWGKIRTDENGYFEIENVTADKKMWLAYSKHSRKVGFFEIPEDYKGQTLDVVLNYGEAEIDGRLVDGDGRGVADKKVELVFETGEGVTYMIPVYRKTDKYGVYEFSTIPCGEELKVRAKTVVDIDGEEKEYYSESVILHDGQIDVQMPVFKIGAGQYEETYDGRSLYSGRILNEQNQPISGVELEMWYQWQNNMSTWTKNTKTDSQGRWKCRLLDGHSELSFRLIHPDYISYHHGDSSRVPSKAELLDGSNIMYMKKGVKVEGVVKDVQGKPIENALVAAGYLYGSSDGKIIEDCTAGRTKSDGSFVVSALPEKKIDMNVTAVGYSPQVILVDAGKQAKPVEIVLKKGRTYRGQVVDQNGDPIEGVKVSSDCWMIDGKRRNFAAITKTDSNGIFSISSIPSKGVVTFSFGKRQDCLQGFNKDMPEDISVIDKITMYPVPVISGKVIDAQTKEPIKKFTVVPGCKWKMTDEKPDWNEHYKKDITDDQGSFEQKWRGYWLTYPFKGAIAMKIVTEGYYSQVLPEMKLGGKYGPFVIELEKCERVIGTIVDPEGNPADKAEIGWVGPGKKAFISEGKFSRERFAHQAETIVFSDKTGHFSMNPEKEDALIVVMHEKGYASFDFAGYKNRSEIQLKPWSRIEVTLDKSKSEKSSKISVITVDDTDDSPCIDWFFNSFETSKRKLAIDHIPAVPLNIGEIRRYQQHDAVYLEPEPGKTYEVHFGQEAGRVKGRIEFADKSSHDFGDPRQSHIEAFMVDPRQELPEKVKGIEQSSFSWLFSDKQNVYAASKTYQKRFIPAVDSQGNFVFENMAVGKYELVVNLHEKLGKNVTCGRGVLKAAKVVGFEVKGQRDVVDIDVVTVEKIVYPEVSQEAPLFAAETFDGTAVSLEDYRGKVVLLDFWGTWCGPCVREIPKVRDIYEAFKDDEDFVLLGMNIDWDRDRAGKFIESEKMGWIQLALGSMAESDIVQKYGIGSVPALVLIGPDGKIISKYIAAEDVKAEVERIKDQM